MSEKTVHEIREEHARRAAEITGAYFDAKDAVRETTEPRAGAYLDRLAPQERMRVLREQKAEAAAEAYETARASYRAEVERYQREVGRRRARLRERLFGVDDPAAATTLARAATADEGELREMLGLAAQTGNEQLGKVVFAAAERRGLGDVLAEYFAGMDGEARELFREWSELPTEDAMRRQREGIDRVLPPPTYPGALDAPLRATT